jgi:two-component sensor histidine kinase
VEEHGQFAQVRVEGVDQLVVVPISWNKPEIPEDIQRKWQDVVDLTARILKVPTGLITRLTEQNLEIVAASRTAGNPYKNNDHDRLGIGMFCETVAGRREPTAVPDIESSDYWKNNPHAGLGMRSYMGVPIKWEDGELFGTFCILDDKSNSFLGEFRELLERFKDLIETDLKNILLQEELEKKLTASETRLREIHHRIKNQFNILASYISLQSRDKSNGELKESLSKIRHRVAALSLIHENLCCSDGREMPSLDAYLKRLCSYILDDFGGSDVDVTYAVEALAVSMEAEISIGLIVSELITNSLKHAFPGGGPKRLSVALRKLEDGHAALEYRDNGVGLPPGFDPALKTSLGMRILSALAKQLRGRLEASSKDGAVFALRFPL